ncbi:MAG: hypothetical protein ACP5IO_03200 [Elusimicrobiales bacterium]
MRGEKEREEDRGIYSVVENFSFKKVLRYRFFLLILFFLFVGITSYLILTSEAEKLAGGKRYSQLSSSSSKLSFSLIEKLKYTVSSLITSKHNEAKSSSSNLSESDKIDDEAAYEETSNFDKASNSPDNAEGAIKKTASSYLAYAYREGYKKNSLESDLAPVSSQISENSVSKTSLSRFDSYSSPKVKIGETKATVGISNDKKTDETKTAMSLLKSAFKTTIMAARDASNDTARAWTSKSFDYTPDIKQTLEYDEKLRASLDRINPNSIPAFLKDPALDSESMKSLKDSDVPGLSSDDEGNDMSDQYNQMKDNNLLTNLFNINPLFNQNLNEQDIDNNSYSVNPQKPDTATSPNGNIIANPSDPPVLGNGTQEIKTDEYGYIRVEGNDGVIHIFDPNTGKILGCEDPNIGACLLPGAAPSCPADIYFV